MLLNWVYGFNLKGKMELRKDYFLDRWVIIASDRKKRPHDFKKSEISKEDNLCYFCPGNEHLTPPEKGRIGEPWKIRWFDNKFSFLKPGNYNLQTHNEFYTFSDAHGYHEVIVETNDHNKQLWDLSIDEIKDILKAYNHRINELSKIPSINYVSIFKNNGRDAGTSISHSHSQVAATAIIPKDVREKCESYKDKCECPYCKIILSEKDSYRRCFENERFIAFTPYASRFSYEILILSKRHIRNMAEFDERDYMDLTEIMKKILDKLKSINAPYNYYIHYSPAGKDLHFHMEICPRLSIWAGFEISSGIIVNAVSPEDAAKFYRGEEV